VREAPKSVSRVARICCASMHGIGLPGFLEFYPIRSRRHSHLTTDPSHQFSHSVHDASRNYIPPGIKASPDFPSNSLSSSVYPSPANNFSCLLGKFLTSPWTMTRLAIFFFALFASVLLTLATPVPIADSEPELAKRHTGRVSFHSLPL